MEKKPPVGIKRKKLDFVDLNHLHYFAQVVSSGSIKLAAEKLGLSPSTLSEHISRLEKTLEVQLFRRSFRKLTLTPEGSQIFQYTRHLMDTALDVRELVSGGKTECYPANVGIVPNLSVVTAYNAVAHYLRHCGRVGIHCHDVKHDDLEKGLLIGRFDFGFSNHPSSRKEIAQRVLSSAEVNLYISATLASKDIKDLARELPLLICGTIAPFTSAELLREYTDEPIPVVAAESPFILHKLCDKGLGIGVFTDDFAKGFIKSSITVIPGIKKQKLQNHTYVHWAKAAEKSGAVKDLMQALKQLSE